MFESFCFELFNLFCETDGTPKNFTNIKKPPESAAAVGSGCKCCNCCDCLGHRMCGYCYCDCYCCYCCKPRYNYTSNYNKNYISITSINTKYSSRKTGIKISEWNNGKYCAIQY